MYTVGLFQPLAASFVDALDTVIDASMLAFDFVE
jgi:hypothetical protein